MAYDIHFQPLTESEQLSTGKLMSFSFTASVAVKGPQKLINRWMKCLLTPKGSDPRDVNYGTGFTELLGINIQNIQDALDAFSLILEDVNNQIRAFDSINLPPNNEKLDSTLLTSFDVNAAEDGFTATVLLRNTAGVSTRLTIPVVQLL